MENITQINSIYFKDGMSQILFVINNLLFMMHFHNGEFPLTIIFICVQRNFFYDDVLPSAGCIQQKYMVCYLALNHLIYKTT